MLAVCLQNDIDTSSTQYEERRTNAADNDRKLYAKIYVFCV